MNDHGIAAVAHRPPPREARPERDGDAARAPAPASAAVAAALTIGWRRVGTRTPGPEPDALGALGRQREHHPHVGALLRRVVQPRALVAELLGEHHLLGRIQRRRKRA